jgi:hypothetical protein
MPSHQSDCGPHVSTSGFVSNIICHCDVCDEGVELGLPSRLSKLCDCDQYRRWICLPCSHKESRTWTNYLEQGRVQERSGYEETFPQSSHEDSLWIHHMPGAMTVCVTAYLRLQCADHLYSSGVPAGKEFLPPAGPGADGV